MNGQNANVASEMVTLLGGNQISVTFLNGGTETVTVLELPIDALPRLLTASDDEIAQIAIYCGKSTGDGAPDLAWAKTLKPASQEAVILEGEKVNADFFGRWQARRMKRIETLMPGFAERLARAARAEAPDLPKASVEPTSSSLPPRPRLPAA